MISKATDAVIDELVTWQNRPLDQGWPIIYIDALWVKICFGSVTSKPVYLAVGVDSDGRKDLLGLWVGWRGRHHMDGGPVRAAQPGRPGRLHRGLRRSEGLACPMA